jgi:hypothetical protein
MKLRLFKTRAEFEAFVAAGGSALHVLILHDNACTPSRCVCEPWYEVRDLTKDTRLDGLERQRKWVKETTS